MCFNLDLLPHKKIKHNRKKKSPRFKNERRRRTQRTKPKHIMAEQQGHLVHLHHIHTHNAFDPVESALSDHACRMDTHQRVPQHCKSI